jgi:putative ABC transport system ATP-binding protein
MADQTTTCDEHGPAPDLKAQPVIVEVRNVNKSYLRGSHIIPVLREINFDIREGEFLALMGPSGSGKSTLLNLIAGIDKVDSGTIVIGGVDITALDETQLARWRATHVGFIFQFYNLIPVLTAYENVELPLQLTGLTRAERREHVEMALSVVNLAHRMDHYPSQLSGGEQQRVAIARAIAKRPQVLLCDEPTGALDSATGVIVLEALEKANRELGTLTVLITHNAGIADMADRVIRLSDGRIADIHANAAKTSAHDLSW